MNTLDPVTRHHIDQAAERLGEEFAGVFSKETIARYMEESEELLGEGRLTVFVPVLVHRFARERLKALAQAEGRLDEGAARDSLRLRSERGPQPDGGRAGKAPLGRKGPRAVSREHACDRR